MDAAPEPLRPSGGRSLLDDVALASPDILYIFDLDERRNVFVNRTIGDHLGYAPEEVRAMGGAFLAQLLHPDDLARLESLIDRWRTASDDDVLEVTYRMRAKSGAWRWFRARDKVFRRAADGHVTRIIGVAQDDTDRRAAVADLRDRVERERRMRNELDHRIRNTLAALIGLIEHSAGSAPGHRPAFVVLRERVEAMAVVHGMLGATGWDELGVAALASAIAARRCGLELAGPPVAVPPDRAQALGLVLDELVRRADGAAMRIAWERRPDGLNVEVTAPGVGSAATDPLLAGLVRGDLGGRVDPAEGTDCIRFTLGGAVP